MSLDVYLVSNNKVKEIPKYSIYIRENGKTIELSPEEWNDKYPDSPVPTGDKELVETNIMYAYNITHNLGKMAAAVDLYYYLWRPEEVGITKAEELILPLAEGLGRLKGNPEYYKTFNPSNGWGDYEGLVKFVESYLQACIDNPDADVIVSR